MRKIFALVFVLLSAAGGVGAGVFLRPPAEDPAVMGPCGDVPIPQETAAEPIAAPTNTAFVKLNNQFVVPVVADQRITSLVVMSLNLEVVEGFQETVFGQEPKLRDAFLQVMFDHANTGGFDGAFTSSGKMDQLRSALLEVSQKILGQHLVGILIVDVVRQDA